LPETHSGGLLGRKSRPPARPFDAENSQAGQMCLPLFMSHLVLCTSVCQQQLSKPTLSADINGDDPPSVANSSKLFERQILQISTNFTLFKQSN
jgi:hypothetical protein